MCKKEIILSLIKSHLILTKLIDGLNDLGLSAHTYYLDLGDIILRMMGYINISENDEIYIRYNEVISVIKEVIIPDHEEQLEILSLYVYALFLNKNLN